MSHVSRRRLLQGAGASALAALTACASREPDPTAPATAAPQTTARALHRDPTGTLALPEGFRARILQRAGEPMSDGYVVPGRPDAMACFAAADGSWVLMRNHELAPGHRALSAYAAGKAPPAETYDAAAHGGVTRLVLDPQTLAVQSSNLVLAGTTLNCAGGVSPWGFLTCEETVDPGHGYVFLCRTHASRAQRPERIPAYGRMRHEAACVDPRTLIAYLTEDAMDSCFYRCVPKSPEAPFEGTLQALRVPAHPRLDTTFLPQGASFEVDWVDVPRPDSEDDDLRMQAQQLGAARIVRGEGMWLAGNDVFFTATVGGRIGRGQIFRLRTDVQRLEVLAEAMPDNALDMPDNLTVSPHGQLYVAEDGAGGNSLRRVTLEGQMTEFGRNIASTSELAGLCFSPDGRVLFVNIQNDGLTLAIEGPFERELVFDAQARHEERVASAWPKSPRELSSGLALMALTALARRKRDAT